MRYDTVVVGSGSAGAALAVRLSEDPHRSVLLLEAGPDYPNLEHLPEEVKYGYATGADVMVSDHNWQFIGKATETAPPMMVPRGKVTGGSSAINGQVFIRGLPEDYDSWADMGADEWSFEKLLPFLRKLETDVDFRDDFHGTDGPIIARRFKRHEWLPAQTAFHDACVSAGFPYSADFNHPDSTGVSPTAFNNPDGIRWSTALGYLNMARHRVNLTIRPDCMAHRIVFDGRRAVGVEVESGGEMFVVEGEETVLCTGAVGSPQLLMLSGVGPADHLRNLGIEVLADRPGVGQNLRDHPMVYVTWKTKEDHEFDGLAPRGQFVLRYTAEGSQLRNDMIFFMSSYATALVNQGGSRMEPLGIRMLVALFLALGAGELLLTSRDPNVQPFLDFNYLQEPFDRQRMRDGVRLALELAEHDEFQKIIDHRLEPLASDLESDEALDEWMMREATTGQHISGTCKMGPASDPMAVVDQYGKVHGLEGLRVVDASIMPDCVRANTNVTSIMIGERVADFMRSGR